MPGTSSSSPDTRPHPFSGQPQNEGANMTRSGILNTQSALGIPAPSAPSAPPAPAHVPAHGMADKIWANLTNSNYPQPPPYPGYGFAAPPPATTTGYIGHPNALSGNLQNGARPLGQGIRAGNSPLAPNPIPPHVGPGVRPGDLSNVPINLETLPPNAYTGPQQLPAAANGRLPRPNAPQPSSGQNRPRC
jgi:hypothetical protein